MIKKVLLVIILLFVVFAMCYFLFKKSFDNNNTESGEKISEGAASTEEKVLTQYSFNKDFVSEKYLEVVQMILKQESLSGETIKSKDELRKLYNIDDNVEHDGFIIENNSNDFCEIELIDPHDKSINESLLIGMMNRFQDIKTEYADLDIMYDDNRICMVQEDGVTILIISNDAEIIHNIISNNR